MRRIIAFITSFCFIFSFAVHIAAAQITSSGGAELTPIKVSYELNTSEADEVYYVDITWGSFENTYKTNDIKVWNPETLMYEIESGTPEWNCSKGANTVKITNHSNTAVTALISYTPNNSYSEVTGTFDKGVISLDAPAENSAYNSAPSDSANLSLSGVLDVEAGTKVDVGTVSVSLVGEPAGSIACTTEGVSYSLYEQGNGIYFASFVAAEDSAQTNTIIDINGTIYYIYEDHYDRHGKDECFCFRAGMSVKLSTQKYDSYKKVTELFAGKSYTLIVNLSDPSAPTASLIEN